MLQKLVKLGRLIPEGEVEVDPLNLNKIYNAPEPYVLLLCFSWNETESLFAFSKVELEEFRSEEFEKYLYVSVQGTGTSNFPTIDVFKREDLFHQEKVDFDKSKAGKKIVKILKKYENHFESLLQELLHNEQLKQSVKDATKDLKRFLLSLKINELYPGSYSTFQQKAGELGSNQYNPDYYTYNKKIYEKKNAVCSLSQKKADKVWGFASPYAFYAVKTEKAPIAGGFDGRLAWRNFPVSPEQSLYLDRGQKFLEENLKFKFCGYPYFLVPEFILTQRYGEEEEKERLNYLKNFEKYSLSDKEDEKILEIDLLEFLSEQKNCANFTLFFYEQNNAEFKILASIDDVFPSHGLQLKYIRDELERELLFSSYRSETYPTGVQFQFHFIKAFFPDNKIEGSFKSDFLKLTRAIFMSKPLSYTYLLQHIMRKIRTDFANDKLYSITLLKAFMLLKFLNKANLIQITSDFDGVPMENNMYEEFFQQHPNFFTTNSRKAIFLEGVLCQKLLNLQYKKRNSTPFRSRLNGMKLSKKDVERLLPEMINKLREYGSAYSELETLISRYILDANLNLTSDETSFYFVMGMNLAKEFKKEDSTEESTEEAIEK